MIYKTIDYRFLILGLAAFLSGANLRVFDSILPNIAINFQSSNADASIVVAAFTLAYGLSQVLYGPLGDKFGRIKIVTIATTIVSIGSIGSALSTNLDQLTLLRLISGIGAAGIIPVSLAWIGDNTSYEDRQTSLGKFITFILLGQILGPTLGGLLTEIGSWRLIFYLFSVIFFITTILLILIQKREGVLGAGKSYIKAPQKPFFAYSDILKDHWCRTVLIVVHIEGALFYGSFAFVGVWIERATDLNYILIGLLLSGFGLGGVLYAMSIKILLTRLGELGFTITATVILFIFFVLLPYLESTILIGIFCVLGGYGFYMLHNTLQTKASEMFPSMRGTAISIFAMSLFSGQAIGTIIFGQISEKYSYEASFTFVGILLLTLGITFSYMLKKQLNRARD